MPSNVPRYRPEDFLSEAEVELKEAAGALSVKPLPTKRSRLAKTTKSVVVPSKPAKIWKPVPSKQVVWFGPGTSVSTHRQEMRVRVFTRDGFECVVCHWIPPGLVADHYNSVIMGRELPKELVPNDSGKLVTKVLTLDHNKPDSLGGAFSLENLQAMCSGCNSKKADTYTEGQQAKSEKNLLKFYKDSSVKPKEFQMITLSKKMEEKERIMANTTDLLLNLDHAKSKLALHKFLRVGSWALSALAVTLLVLGITLNSLGFLDERGAYLTGFVMSFVILICGGVGGLYYSYMYEEYKTPNHPAGTVTEIAYWSWRVNVLKEAIVNAPFKETV